MLLLRHIFCLIILALIVPTTPSAFAQQQQPSMVWDEASKSWVSAPPAVTTPTTPPPTQQQPQIIYQQQPAPQQTVIPVAQTTVDFGTLATIITPIIAGIAGIFVKNRKDLEKKTEEAREDTIKAIEQAISTKLKQITPIAEQSAKQDVKISQLADEVYKIMAEKANEIHDKPEIQQQKLIEDIVKSQMIAEQTKAAASSPIWDEKSKSWISK